MVLLPPRSHTQMRAYFERNFVAVDDRWGTVQADGGDVGGVGGC